VKPSLRRNARKLLVQALYEIHISKNSWSEVLNNTLVNNLDEKFDRKYFSDVLRAIEAHLSEVDDFIEEGITRKFKDINPVELSILRLGCYELKYQYDVPAKVAINEALELAKIFGSEDGYKFVNGVMDKLLKMNPQLNR